MDLEQAVIQPNRESTSTPRWVKVFGVVAIILVLLFVVIVITGIGGRHGPGRHIPSGDARRDTLRSSATGDPGLSGSGLGGHAPSKGDH